MHDERRDLASPVTAHDVEARFAAGDVEAFEALFRAWQAEVFRWVVRIVRDRAAAPPAVQRSMRVIATCAGAGPDIATCATDG